MATTFVLLALFVGVPVLAGHIIYFGSSERHQVKSHAGRRRYGPRSNDLIRSEEKCQDGHFKPAA
jgi:hypothetical protein